MQEQVDWEAVERSPEFQALVSAKRKFVIPRVVFFLGWYLAFVLLAGYAEGFMNERVYEGLTVGYTLALTQFVMVWYLAWEYLRKADREFEPLEEKVTAMVEAAQSGSASQTEVAKADDARGGRFERDATTEPTQSPEVTS